MKIWRRKLGVHDLQLDQRWRYECHSHMIHGTGKYASPMDPLGLVGMLYIVFCCQIFGGIFRKHFEKLSNAHPLKERSSFIPFKFHCLIIKGLGDRKLNKQTKKPTINQSIKQTNKQAISQTNKQANKQNWRWFLRLVKGLVFWAWLNIV